MGEISIWIPFKKKSGGRYVSTISDNGKEVYLLGRDWEMMDKGVGEEKE
jgi:hypothetical protein